MLKNNSCSLFWEGSECRELLGRRGEDPEISKRERSQTVLDQELRKQFKMKSVRE